MAWRVMNSGLRGTLAASIERNNQAKLLAQRLAAKWDSVAAARVTSQPHGMRQLAALLRAHAWASHVYSQYQYHGARAWEERHIVACL